MALLVNIILVPLIFLGFFVSCQNKSKTNDSGSSDQYSLDLTMDRVEAAGYDPFNVTVVLKQNGSALAGQTLQVSVDKGTLGAVSDLGDGRYQFLVSPSASGVYKVTVSFGGVSLVRKAIVLDSVMTGSGQPMIVPGDYAATDGYEDGITISPDGEYLFIQYAPAYFSGILNHASICSSGSYTVGYDLGSCSGRTNSFLVFDLIGPYSAPYRPDFPSGSLTTGLKFKHLTDLVVPGAANGIVAFPALLWGLKKQSDGTFAEPFRIAFEDERGTNTPFGLSLKMNGDGTATFLMAWNNYLNDLGDDKPDIYSGTMVLGQKNNLGNVSYSGPSYSSISPNVSPVSFTSHVGTQGNPHLYYDNNGVVKSIWTDDEQVTHNLAVYRLTAGVFPNGTWVLDALPSDINTAGDERQPFFTGNELIFTRDSKIVRHLYTPTNGACSNSFTHNDCWGSEEILIGGVGGTTVGQIYSVGEPTVATVNGSRFLYFVAVEVRNNPAISVLVDYDLNPGFVKLP